MKTYLSFLMLIAAVLHCNAQITLTSFHAMDVGTSATYSVTQSELELTNDGADQVWDASLALGPQITNDFVSVFDTPFSFSYPDANVVNSSNGNYVYFEATQEALVNHGFVIQGALNCVYTDPVVQAQYPMNFGDTFIDDFQGEITLQIDETMLSRFGQIEVTADAYGDLILPYDTIENTLRLKSVATVTDSLNGVAFTGTETVYSWYDAEYGNVIANYSIVQNTGAPATFTFAFVSEQDYTSINEHALLPEIKVFPNPSSEYIQISGLNGATDFTIHNQQGQEVLRGTTNGEERIYTNELPSGIYFIEIKDEAAIRRTKLLIE